MTRADDILAIVVSYNGGIRIEPTVQALCGQVDHVHIVDNGSDADSLLVLDRLEQMTGVTVTRLGRNTGVGHALNVGIKRAKEMGFGWLLSMDQDSVVETSMVAAFRAAIERDRSLACLAPRIIAENGRRNRTEAAVLKYAITSGNLVRMDVFDTIGGYDEGFFIDCIDFDFSLRVRQAGYLVHLIPEAIMHHQLGGETNVPGLLKPYYSLHSPERRYYEYRNYMYMAERYLLKFPMFIIKLGVAQAILTVLIAFYDPDPLTSYRSIFKGIGDYFARRLGPYAGRER